MTEAVTKMNPDALVAKEIFEREIGATVSALAVEQFGPESS